MKFVSLQGRFSSSPLIKDWHFQGSELLTVRSGITWPSQHHPVGGTGAWGTSTTDLNLTPAIVVLCLWSLIRESNYFICIEHRGWGWCLRDFIQLLLTFASPPLIPQQVGVGGRGDQKLMVGLTSESCLTIRENACKALRAVSGTE